MAVKQSRGYDALFDTTYTVSGARDHYKQQGQVGFVLQKVKEHGNLFSELQHYTIRVKANTQLSAAVDRSFHPHQHNPQLLKWQSNPQQVTGAHLYKYFKRPLLPAGASLTMPLRLALQQPVQQVPPPPPEPKAKDAGTQSDYRESEAQTLPWSPDWVLPTNPAVLAKQAALCAKFNIAGPEVLQLAHLTFGNGLPGSLQEVRRLERLRTKRAFEATLPPIDDVARLPERQAMIEAWEVQEWVEREEEIKSVQEERLALLAQALQVREEEVEAAHREQVQRRTAALLASKANKFAAIHTERLKTFRKLAAAKDKVTSKFDKKGKSAIIEQYADYGSALYAPPQRDGHFPDVIPLGAATAGQPTCVSSGRQAGQLHPAALAPNSIAGLDELEGNLPRKSLKLPGHHKAASSAAHKHTYKQRVDAAVQQDVATIHDMLQAAKAETGTRGIGKVWPCPLEDGPASAAMLAAAAAAAAAEGNGSSRHGLRSPGGKSGVGSLAAAAAAAAAASAGAAKRSVLSAARAGAAAAAATAAGTGPSEAPPPPDPDGTHAALVLLQRLLRGRAVQNQMYAGKESRLQLIRELRLDLEGTGGWQPRPEVRDVETQERDAAAGAALCRLCCLLASDDQAAIAQVLSDVAEQRLKQRQGQGQQLQQKVPEEQQVQEQQVQEPQQQVQEEHPSTSGEGPGEQEQQEHAQEQTLEDQEVSVLEVAPPEAAAAAVGEGQRPDESTADVGLAAEGDVTGGEDVPAAQQEVQVHDNAPNAR